MNQVSTTLENNNASENLLLKKEQFRKEIRTSNIQKLMMEKRIKALDNKNIQLQNIEQMFFQIHNINSDTIKDNTIQEQSCNDQQSQQLQQYSHLENNESKEEKDKKAIKRIIEFNALELEKLQNSNSCFDKQYQIVQLLRKIISMKNAQMAYEFIMDSNVLFLISKYLYPQYDQQPNIQFEATYFACNFGAAPDKYAFELGAYQLFQNMIRLLQQTNNLMIIDNILWCFANLAGEQVYIKKQLVNQGIGNLVVQVYQKYKYEDCIRTTIAMLISNFFKLEKEDIDFFITNLENWISIIFELFHFLENEKDQNQLEQIM